MVIVIFRSRVRPEMVDEYYAHADAMARIARTMPGFISYKGYSAEDGERFYEDYTLYAMEGPRVSHFSRVTTVVETA